jgi:type I restriction enzyme S subunit
VILRDTSSKKANHNFIPDDLSNYKVVEPGQLVINKMKAWSGSLGVAGQEGIVSPAYFVYDVAIENKRFTHYLLRSRSVVDEFARCSGGVRVGQWDLNIPAMKSIRVRKPSASDQELIVRYLDHAELRIAKAIAAKQAVVNLMQEARQSLVSEIVATGLKRDVELRDSEVPGLGLIPANWPTLRAKHVWRSIDVRSKTGTEERLTVSSSSGIVPRSTKNVTMFEAASYVGHKIVQPNDLVINSLWAWAGGLGVSDHAGLVSPVYGVYRLREGAQCDPHFMHNLLRSNVCQWQFQVRSKGIWKSRLSLTDEAFFEIALPVPPIEEQQAVAQVIRLRTADLDQATDSVLQEISLLKEYRTRLISDVVTGKLDVREEAAKLPVIDPDELAEVTAGAGLAAEDDGDDE